MSEGQTFMIKEINWVIWGKYLYLLLKSATRLKMLKELKHILKHIKKWRFGKVKLVTGRVDQDPETSSSPALPSDWLNECQRPSGCSSYSRGLESVWACRRRCNPSPVIYFSPPHEEGASLTSAGSRVSVQPSGVRIKSEVGVMETSRCIPPSSGSLIVQNKTQVNNFPLMREISGVSHCMKEAKA